MRKPLLFLLLTLSSVARGTPVPITLEHATTAEELTWGLMQRHFLPANHGMLFHYSMPRYVHIWMFNCFIDLSVAFIDDQNIIREIHELKAHPHKMATISPITHYQSLNCYLIESPVAHFFLSEGVKSHFPVSFVLEMNAEWFARSGVHLGDTIQWKNNNGTIFRQNP